MTALEIFLLVWAVAASLAVIILGIHAAALERDLRVMRANWPRPSPPLIRAGHLPPLVLAALVFAAWKYRGQIKKLLRAK